jgi:transforming growth factor-beta-induced protein
MRTSTRIAATAASAGLIAAAMAAPASAAPSNTIFDIVEGSAVHGTLEFVLEETGLDAVLEGKRQFTLFAPTDSAFAALPAGVVAGLLSPAQEAAGYPALTNILLYHVAPGERFAADVLSSSKIRTMNKSFAVVDGATIDGAAISGAGTPGSALDASNGVVHVIDSIMLP